MSENKIPTLAFLMPDPERPFLHRDVSWIQFNDRVLAEARTNANPPIKRLKFLSITASNLDEFFMIRFASLVRSISSNKAEDSRRALQRIYGTILSNVQRFGERQLRTFKIIKRVGKTQGILFPDKSDAQAPYHGKDIFMSEVLPHLQPQSNFQFSMLAELRNLQSIVYLSESMSFLIPASIPTCFMRQEKGKYYFYFLDELILNHLSETLTRKEKPLVLRITRDADFTLDLSELDSASIPDVVRKNLGSREKGRIVRLQYNGMAPKDFIEQAADALKLDLHHCFRAPGTLCLHGLLSLANQIHQGDLNNPPLRSTVPRSFEPAHRKDLFKSLREIDFVLHHPYDSFDAFLSWLKLACDDPEVTMIEQTIYRADSASEIVNLLKRAAKTKKVRVVLELRARFDESNNLKIAEDLRQAGAEVHFGFGNLKLHAKVTLVTRKTKDQVLRFTHLSTGNYNAKTARLYTDISILTGNEDVGADARYFFDSIYKQEVPSQFKQLVVAPTKLHAKIRALIKQETEAAKSGKKARIVAKVNALVDEKIIEDLYSASQAGVKIDLIVRGACTLIPGVKGLSENINVISIVDRFLEHSRIYYFESSEVIYLSSADWMPRNFFSRLEIAFPVLDKRIYRFITEIVIPGYLKDNVKARKLTAKGTWMKVPRLGPAHRAQWYFEELAASNYKGIESLSHRFFKDSSTSLRP